MKKYIVTLTKDERKTLSDIASKGKQKSQKNLIENQETASMPGKLMEILKPI
jgi:hypothetical protein